MTTTLEILTQDLSQIALETGDWRGTASAVLDSLEPDDRDESRFYWDHCFEDGLDAPAPYGENTYRIIDEYAGGVVGYVGSEELAQALVRLLNVFPNG